VECCAERLLVKGKRPDGNDVEKEYLSESSTRSEMADKKEKEPRIATVRVSTSTGLRARKQAESTIGAGSDQIQNPQLPFKNNL
jgi:hypothetical protein